MLSSFARAFLAAMITALFSLAASAQGSAATGTAPSSGPKLLRISLENPESHVQTRMVRIFAERLSSAVPGVFAIELHSGASLFRDADVLPALAQGKVEMAVPGIWQLDRYAPDAAALMLPSVFGRDEGELESLADGALGRRIAAQLEAAQSVRAIGRFMELGYLHLFGVKRALRGADALQGLSVRVAGGKANAERIAAMGALPIVIPPSDLRRYIEGGLVGALLSSYETVWSGGYDAWGVSSAYEDKEYFGFYIPLVGKDFWESLSPGSRAAIADAWESIAPASRAAAKEAQAAAAAELARRGMRIFRPDRAELETTRARLLELEDGIASRLGISAGALADLRAGIGR
ncbi:MAG: TRAP transporter substrate-binding protein DctP [Spirochaetaceae bacterium]|nr:TRAP transporter substrate-binding protein DctP [Spirochaetaceae bacterium]